MLAKLRTFSLLGIEALPVEVEVDVSPGALPKTVLVGLPEAADRGGCWSYVAAYACDGGLEPITACQRVLKRTCDAVALILDTAEALRAEGGV